MSQPEILPRYPVFERVPKKDYGGYIIILITITILVIVGSLILYGIYRNDSSRLISRCEAGLCAVNISTGVKRCPANSTDQLSYDLAFEDCTSRNYCQSRRASCSLLANGTLNCKGVCGAGNEQCNCIPPPK